MDIVTDKQHIDTVIENIEKARLHVSAHHIVKIVAVSKYSDNENIEKLYKLGQRGFGENKVQDLTLKNNILKDYPLEWHFIGRLQKNKINALIDLNPFLIQSIDSFELAQEIDKRLKVKNKKLNGLLQINSADEKGKAGVKFDEALEIYKRIQDNCDNINLQGVMSIGAHTDNIDDIKKSFKKTREIFDKLDDVKYCSMGMSGDFELAIECGSNLIRVGGLIFNGK